MKRVQNWRDYLDDNYEHKQKFNKKKRKLSEEDDQTYKKSKPKRK
mgnify:CR=1 FL=1|tara:strand:- start:174 stop:308 length:135 start_codon:yes stop_codon:yes gene_type:complete